MSPASAQEDLLARTASLGCEPLGPVPAQDPLPNGALAGVECIGPLDGVSEIKLFTFPGTYRLRLYHRARVDDADAVVLPDPRACRRGQTGVRKWEHGRVACWVPRGGSKPVLHWTDERNGRYGVIRGEAGTERRLNELWQAVTVELEPRADQPQEDPLQDPA